MAFRQPPTTSRRIGFELSPPQDMTVEPTKMGARMRGAMGELEVEVFQAALVIDRDGILEEKLQQTVNAVLESDAGARVLQTIPIELPGASGVRSDIELVRPMGQPRPEQPYIAVFAIAPLDFGIDGGLIVRVRSASPDWDAVQQVLHSLRFLSRRATTGPSAANE